MQNNHPKIGLPNVMKPHLKFGEWRCRCRCCRRRRCCLGPENRAYFGICLVFLKSVYGIFHRFEKELWCRLFPPLLLLVKAPWAPFWPLSGRNLAKKGLAGSLWISMIFQAAGPLFGFPTAAILQKGVWPRFSWKVTICNSCCYSSINYLVAHPTS